MKNKILGVIGMVWGGLIILNWLLGISTVSESGAYAAGASCGAVFGAVMFLVGLVTFFKKPKQKG